MGRSIRQVWVAIALVSVVSLPLPGASQERFRLTPESTAPAGTTADFGGTWRLRTVQNAEFELTLRVDGDQVTGSFLNTANGTYNGTLTGTAKPNGRMSFTWVQPAMGPATGTGTIHVHTDDTLGGGITYKAPGAKQATYYRWYATRKSRQVSHLRVTPLPAPPAATPSAMPGSANAAYNSAVLKYAVDHLGQRLGRGECTDLVTGALAYANARPGDFTNQDGHYVWGQKISGPPQPGDIIQLVNVKLSFKTPNSWGSWTTGTQHSAIIESVERGTLLHVIHQNSPTGGPVVRGDIDLGWTLEQGDYAFFRAVTP
jgi:hypothetical protein